MVLSFAAWTAVIVVFHGFLLLRVYIFMVQSEDAALRTWAFVFMPSGSNPNLAAEWFSNVHSDQSFQYQILFGSIFGSSMCFELSSFLRNKYIILHNTIGYLSSHFGFVHSAFLFYRVFVKSNPKEENIEIIVNLTSFYLESVGLFVGLEYIKKRDFKRHRAFMIIAAAGYFLEPLSIVFLALFARINAFGSVDSYSQFSDSYVKASVFLSLMICFGVGTYHAFGTPSKRFSLPQGYKAMKH